MKNCTCSKEGYKTEWVLLGIVEDTTYDFVLTSNNPLEVEVTWEAYKIDGQWYVDFICNSSEPLDRLEIYINDGLMHTAADPILPYVFSIEWCKAMKSYTFKFVFYGRGGDTAEVIIDGSDIKSTSYGQQSIFPLFFQMLQRLMNIR
jgi:hypothetical protein